MLYHASKTAGLKELTPRVSTHGKAFVYALKNRALALIFGAAHDDLDFIIGERPKGAEIWECYPHAFDLKFEGAACSLYELSEDSFQPHQTPWPPEWVSPQAVKVVSERPVVNLKEELQALEAGGDLVIHRYSQDPAYLKRIAGHVTDRIIRFDLLNAVEEDPRLRTHFGKLTQALKEVVSGHLLIP